MKSILVVDDSPVIRRMLNLTLKKAGFAVMTAEDGTVALQHLSAVPIDLALIDINMPNMNGLTLLKEIRQNGAYAEMPVVMLTSSGEEHDRAEAKKAGANGFLNKPAGARELLATINELTEPQESL